jgi:hypothetical protein
MKIRRQKPMLNVQVSMLNECSIDNEAMALTHYFIDNSLEIDNCELIIKAMKGAV